MDNKTAIINRGKVLQAESEPTLNHVNNTDKELNINLRRTNSASTRNAYHSSSNKVNNNPITPKFKLIVIRHAPTNVQTSDSCNNNANDMKEQEIMQIQTRSTHESITKKDNDIILHDSCSILKTDISECKSKVSQTPVSHQIFKNIQANYCLLDTVPFSSTHDEFQKRVNQSEDKITVSRDSNGNRTKAINNNNSVTIIRPGINFVNTYSSANKCRNNKKVLRDNKKGVSPKRVNRTLEIYSLPNMDTPPSETDEL